jgi:predicted dehydrogenase
MLGIGLYGVNGHQIHNTLVNHPAARLVAVAAFPREQVPPELCADGRIAVHETLDQLLQNPEVELVSLCSPRRVDQAKDAVACLQAGRHVYAEKPCALSERALDWILDAAAKSGKQFHEMAGTAFEQPYAGLREVVRSGVLGEIIQVFAQKSYPFHGGRPQDEAVDGGLICQNAIHAVRMVEQVAGQRIVTVHALETSLGNPEAGGGLRIASVLGARLENGGLASIVANYLNPKGFGCWGNEHLRIFGWHGMVESVDGGRRTRLVLGDKDLGPVDVSKPVKPFFDAVVDAVLGRAPMPLPLAAELHPTRVVIRAKQSAAG